MNPITLRYPVKLEPYNPLPVKLGRAEPYNPGRCGTAGSAFEEIAARELQVGVKYMIKSMPKHYTYYTGIFKKQGSLQVFEHVYYHGPFGKHVNVENEFIHMFYYKRISQKEKIQQAMEKRALHIVLRRIVDESFVWE